MTILQNLIRLDEVEQENLVDKVQKLLHEQDYTLRSSGSMEVFDFGPLVLRVNFALGVEDRFILYFQTYRLEVSQETLSKIWIIVNSELQSLIKTRKEKLVVELRQFLS